jgi:hypothetical protein
MVAYPGCCNCYTVGSVEVPDLDAFGPSSWRMEQVGQGGYSLRKFIVIYFGYIKLIFRQEKYNPCWSLVYIVRRYLLS